MEWEQAHEYEHGIEVRISRDTNPNMVAVFDEGERVTDPTAALQADEVC